MEFMSELTQWHWLGLAAVLGILEVMLGASFFLLWLALSACLIAIILMVVPSFIWQYQLLVFAMSSLACILYWNWHLKHKVTPTDRPDLNRRSEQYVGRVFTLVEPIVNGRGKVKVDDSFWQVSGADLSVGSKVKVIAVDGVLLKVEEHKEE